MTINTNTVTPANCYVVLLEPIGDVTDEVRKQQRSRLAEMSARGELLWSGPFTDGPGGMAILRAGSLDAAKALYATTPLAAQNLASWQIRPWDARAGVVANLLADR